MRFSAAAVALFAGLAVALPGGDIETIYQTEEVTITSCAPTVTDCPGSTTTEPTVIPTSSSPVIPEQPEVPTSSSPVVPPVETPVVPEVPEVPSESISVIPVTTCIPTVTYSTITITPTPTVSKPVIPVVPTSVAPTGSATPSPSPPAFTGAANAITNSFGFAGVAAVAAVFLA
ncbi:hypothetical protein BDV12DRAFT_194206 [Aspergillus spectabilis]